MVRLHRELPGLGAKGLLCIHDEYIAQAPLQQAARAKEMVEQIMEQQMHELVPSVPIRAQASICETWG